MSILDLILLAAGLSMDAFAVSICKGLSLRNVKWHHMMIVGLWFGIFQALMPSIGYVLGSLFIDLIDAYATSIDALAVGVTFAFMNIQLIPSVTIIGVTTFLFSAVGIKAGGLFGNHYKSKAELVGGIVLILIGVKILLQGLGII